MCIDKCQTCYLRAELSAPFEVYDHAIDLSNTKAYALDERGSLVDIEYGRYDDKKICLIMDFYDNGSSTQIILENEKGSYFLPAFFGEPVRFASLDEAKEYWLSNSDSISDSGDFY